MYRGRSNTPLHNSSRIITTGGSLLYSQPDIPAGCVYIIINSNDSPFRFHNSVDTLIQYDRQEA